MSKKILTLITLVTIVLANTICASAGTEVPNATRQINFVTSANNVPKEEALSASVYSILHSNTFLEALQETTDKKLYKDYRIKILEDTVSVLDNILYGEAYLEDSNVGIDVQYNLDTHECELEYGDTVTGEGVGIIGLHYLPKNVRLELIQDYIDPSGESVWIIRPAGRDLRAIDVHNIYHSIPIGMEN